MTFTPGSRFGPYEIVAPLGAGGMGEVYRAKDTRIGRDVAIKVLPEEFFEDKERVARFEREARLLATLNHPGIATLYSFEEIPGTPGTSSRHIIVMELLEGETLRERLLAGPASVRRAIDIAVQIAQALAAAHEKGIVHRDLKPENVFLAKDERVKILDFGLAKLPQREQAVERPTEADTLSLLTDAGTVFGTVAYMSPEQVRGEPVDQRSDIFSFGTIVYEMLSGKNPFRGSATAEWMSNILKEDPAALSEGTVGIPPPLSSIVGRCLEKKPELRFQSAADLAFTLEELPAASSPAAALAQRRVESRPRRALILGVALAALAAAAAGAYLAGKRAGLRPDPTFHRLTFRRGYVGNARFVPDAQTVLYAATWEGEPFQVYSTRKGSPETTPLGGPETLLLGVSSRGELALSLRTAFPGNFWRGTLAVAPLGGGAPREILNDVQEADWSPDGSSLAVVRGENPEVTRKRITPKNRLEFPPGTMLLESQGRLAQPRVSRDGRLIAFLDVPLDGKAAVAVVDREGRKRIVSSGWAAALGLAWSPRGDEIWFTASKSGEPRALWGVSLAGRERLVARWDGSWMLQDASQDGRVLLTRGGVQSSMVATTPAGERDLSWLDGSFALDISADGSLVLFSEGGEAVGGRRVAHVRRMDGSPAVRLGEGTPAALSPDGQWALVYRAQPAESLILVPIGPGEARALPRGAVSEYAAKSFLFPASFFPNGKRVVFGGAESGKPHRLFLQDVEGGLPRPFGEESLYNPLVSPDGRWVAASTESEKNTLFVYTADGQHAQKVAIEKGDVPIRWGEDSRSVFLRQRRGMTMSVFRLDLRSGRRQLWREINAPDPAGLLRGIDRASFFINMTSDGKHFVSTYQRNLNHLYLVEGLK